MFIVLVFSLGSKTCFLSMLALCWKGLPKIMRLSLGINQFSPCT